MIDLFKDVIKLRPLLTRRDKKKFVFLFILMSIGSTLEALGIGAIPAFVTLITKPSAIIENRWVGHYFTNLPDEPTVSLIIWASFALFGLIIFKNIFLILVYYVQTGMVSSMRVNLGDRMFRVYQSAPYDWYLQRNSSELLRNIQSDTTQIISGVLMPFLNLILALIMTVLIIVTILLSMPGIAVLALTLIGGGVFIVIRSLQNQYYDMGKITRRELKLMIKSIQQGFGAFIDARIMGCESYLNKTYRNSLMKFAKVSRKQMTIDKATPYAIETLVIFGLLIILFVLIQPANSHEDILPVFSLLGVAIIRLKQLAAQIAGAVNKMNSSRAFIPGIVNDMHELNEIESMSQMAMTSECIIDSFHSLHLEKVTYSYPNIDNSAVKDISLSLKRGESIAFAGTTGCGKSTLINIILGLLEPQTGQINVNGGNVYQDLKGWYKLLGYVPQSIYLVDDTILANVAFGVPLKDVKQEQIWLALRSACLDEFVLAQPNSLDTIVGERGVRLSGGQRQRIGIARALYHNPEVLVMDEGTSALDNTTEDNVMKAIQNLKQDRTLIMVAHRLSTVKDCDRIYFMKNGKVESIGTFNELIESSADFQEMAKGQASSNNS